MNAQGLIITGAPRSGTTLLASMIGGHRDIGVIDEWFASVEQNIIGKQIVGNKLTIPNQVRYKPTRLDKMLNRQGLSYKLAKKIINVFASNCSILPRKTKHHDLVVDFTIEELILENHYTVLAIIRDPEAVVYSNIRNGFS
jgi:hypothetical protein